MPTSNSRVVAANGGKRLGAGCNITTRRRRDDGSHVRMMPASFQSKYQTIQCPGWNEGGHTRAHRPDAVTKEPIKRDRGGEPGGRIVCPLHRGPFRGLPSAGRCVHELQHEGYTGTWTRRTMCDFYGSPEGRRRAVGIASSVLLLIPSLTTVRIRTKSFRRLSSQWKCFGKSSSKRTKSFPGYA